VTIHKWDHRWWRRFDLVYWQMQDTLGYPIPCWVEAKWPGVWGGNNPFKCGMCGSRERYPELHWRRIKEAADKKRLHTLQQDSGGPAQ